MRITYNPENLAGAERYLVSVNACQGDDARAWLEASTLKGLTDAVTRGNEFPIIYRGIGFFYTVVGRSTAPQFASEFDPPKSMTDDESALLDVTYWVAADAVRT